MLNFSYDFLNLFLAYLSKASAYYNPYPGPATEGESYITFMIDVYKGKIYICVTGLKMLVDDTNPLQGERRSRFRSLSIS